MIFPDNKKFAFTIFDDTDNSTIENIKPVYDLLYDLGIITTKSVWSKSIKKHNKFTGLTLEDDNYLNYILSLKEKGFEIALHNVTSGNVLRNEIIEGIELFNNKIGYYPYIHVNHSSNTDNIYWGSKRFLFPFNIIHSFFNKKRYLGEEELSPYFWGDYHKKHIKYTRNHTFNNINTYSIDSRMPYYEKSKLKYSNFWFSSTNAMNREEFNNVVTKANIDKLCNESGICILYTHFASGFVENNVLDKNFEQNLKYLASKGGWFVPVGELLDYLLESNFYSNYNIGYFSKLLLDIKWFKSKIMNRCFK